jgi:hypothetical protein
MKAVNIKLHYLLAILLVTVIAGTALGYEFRTNPFHRDPTPTANVFYLFETGHGTWSGQAGNLITNLGDNYVRNAIGFANATGAGTVNATQYISLSNDASPLVTWTVLPVEVTANGFTRSLGTVSHWMNGTNYAYNVSKTFTATGTQQLQCAGLNWSPTLSGDPAGGSLFACASFTSQATFNSGDNCTITWVITWAR